MDVSIIVVAWNVRDLVYDCLKSVYRETYGIDFEVIYVDNGSEDGSLEMVKKEFPEARIIANDENLGFIKANNQGIRIAQGRYVLLLNSDTIVLDNAIAKTVKFADDHPDAAIVGCRVLNPDGTLQRNIFQFYSTLNMFFRVIYLNKLFPKNKLFGRKRYAGWNFDTVKEIDVNVGCYSLVRVDAIKEVGLMDEIYFVYGDDIDWCYRFVKHGWKIMFTPNSEIIHYGGQTTKNKPVKFQYQLFGSGLINVKKHYSYSTFIICRILTSLFFFLRFPYWIILSLFQKKDRKKTIQTARGYLIGGFYALFDWKSLLINKNDIEDKI